LGDVISWHASVLAVFNLWAPLWITVMLVAESPCHLFKWGGNQIQFPKGCLLFRIRYVGQSPDARL